MYAYLVIFFVFSVSCFLIPRPSVEEMLCIDELFFPFAFPFPPFAPFKEPVHRREVIFIINVINQPKSFNTIYVYSVISSFCCLMLV